MYTCFTVDMHMIYCIVLDVSLVKFVTFFVYDISRYCCRSPGGTPLKVKSTNQEPSHDPGNIIASALRKKFASVRRSIGSPLEGSIS